MTDRNDELNHACSVDGGFEDVVSEWESNKTDVRDAGIDANQVVETIGGGTFGARIRNR